MGDDLGPPRLEDPPVRRGQRLQKDRQIGHARRLQAMGQRLALTYELPDQVLNAHLKSRHLIRCACPQQGVLLAQELAEKLRALGLADETSKNDLLHMVFLTRER